MLSTATVGQYMSTSIITLAGDMDIMEAGRVFVANSISGAPVIDEEGRVIGMLTEADCFKTTMQAGYYQEPGGRVFEFMTEEVTCVSPETSILDLAELFLKGPYHRYPVIDEGRLLGIISRRDALRALLDLA
jgi:CBS domain-containing protein